MWLMKYDRPARWKILGAGMKKVFGLAAPLSMIATAALATDTIVKRLEPYGDISLRSLAMKDGGDSLNMWLGDFGVRLSPLVTSGSLTYGFYVGYDGFGGIPKDSTEGSGYGTVAVTLESGLHMMSFGVPRTVIHDTFNRRGATSIALQDADVFFSDWTRGSRAMAGTESGRISSIYGLRYDGDYDKTALSVGVFSGDVFDENVQSVQATLKHDIGRVSFRAGLEHLNAAYSVSSYLLGATAQFAKASAGVDVSLFDLPETNLKSVQIFGSYKINEQLHIGASYLAAEQEGYSEQSSTLGVEYMQPNGTYVRLIGEDSNAYEFAVGVRF